MARPDDKSIMRSLGEFVGHVWRGVKADPAKQGDRRTLRHDIEEETRDGPEGRVTLRRTTIEEIEVDRSK